jgi:hypothetical protein
MILCALPARVRHPRGRSAAANGGGHVQQNSAAAFTALISRVVLNARCSHAVHCS